MKRNIPYYGIFIWCFAMSGCISQHTERVSDVNPLGWEPADTIWITYPNSDTLSARNISVLLRFHRPKDGEPVRTVIRTVAPDSAFYEEPVLLNISSYGIKANDHYEAVIPYRTDNILSLPGEYRFGFIPVEVYKGITAVGISMD